ncbi:MAG: 3-phosphoshikimate 1-carboxyvinyltransferase [Actinomycetota bacterium]
MRIRITPGSQISGLTRVPGDKSIAHRWLILSSTARGRSRLRGLPGSLDVLSTAECLAALVPKARPGLQAWTDVHRGRGPELAKGRGFTWNLSHEKNPPATSTLDLELETEGRGALVKPADELGCGNSGTTIRLLCGLLAAAPFTATLSGDESLNRRPMERVAEPLRVMGASVLTQEGRPPIQIEGSPSLSGVRWEQSVPSAQVKSAILLAGTAAAGRTTVVEPAATRDHTERALAALGAPIERDGLEVSIHPFQHGGLEGEVPGDPSSAAFLLAAAALTRSRLRIEGVGLNPTRTGFVRVLQRMGVQVTTEVLEERLGEPVGTLEVVEGSALVGTSVSADEFPLLVDEVPVLAALAAHASGQTVFRGAGELRVKESDRLTAIIRGLAGLGGRAEIDGEDLVIPGGGLPGGLATSGGDHRMGMSFAIAALGADGPCEIDGIEAANVSFPGFVTTLVALGADIEET